MKKIQGKSPKSPKNLWAIAIIALVSLYSCTKKENAGEAAQAQAESGQLVFESPTEINMIGWRFPITEFYAEELESLNSIDNLSVATQLLDTQSVREQVRLALAGGGESPYEIVHGDNPFLTELASNGQVIALDEYIAKYRDQYDLGDIDDSLYKLGSPDGKIYGIPITANTMFYFYNMDIFEQYNLSPPDTYADVINISKELENAGADIDLPFAINLHAGWAWRIEFLNFLNGFGGKLLDADGMPLFNQQPGVQALELMLEIADATMGEKGLSWSIDDVEIGLETGRLASATTWASRAANMDDPTKSEYVGRIGFAPAPKVSQGGRRAAPASADFYMIPANTSVDPDLIFRVIAKVTDLETQRRGADYSLMTRQKISEERKDVRYANAALTSISEGGATPSTHKGNPIVISLADSELSQAVNRRDDLQGLLDEMAEAYIAEARQQGAIE